MGFPFNNFEPALLGRKPIGRARLNTLHPLAHIFKSFVVFNEMGAPVDLVTGETGTLDAGASWTIGAKGPQISATDSAASAVRFNRPVLTTEDGYQSGALFGYDLQDRNNSASHDPLRLSSGSSWYITHRDWITDGWFRFFLPDAANYISFKPGWDTHVVAAFTDHTAGVENLLTAYWDGGNKFTGSVAATAVTTDAFRIGPSGTGTSNAGWTTHFVALFHTPRLADAIWNELTLRPFAPFGIPLILDDAVPYLTMRVITAGGGGLPTINGVVGAASINGVLAANVASVNGVPV